MSVDSSTFRKALGNFASSVTIVTSFDHFTNKPVGVTVSSFCSVSEDPPLVLFCLNGRSSALLPINANGHFIVNILATGQQDLSERFAQKNPEKWDGVSYQTGLGNAPILPGTVATLECSLNKEVKSGDHSIFVGLVESVRINPEAEPLLYHHNRYTTLSEVGA